MGRWLHLLVLGACSYTAPANNGDDPPPQDAPPPDSPPADAMLEPDAPPPDTQPPSSTTDHVASQDTWIDSVFQNQNFNFGNDSSVISDGSPPAVTLMRFDLSGLPTTSVVTAVELHIFTTSDQGQEVTVFPMLESWGETTATWKVRATGLSWSADGAAPPARGTTAIATFTPNAGNSEFTADVDPGTVQGWVTTPATNFGIAITSTNTDGVVFRSRTASNGKPFLRVTHTP